MLSQLAQMWHSEVTYATPYASGSLPVAPIVIPEQSITNTWNVGGVTSTGFQVYLSLGNIPSSDIYDLKLLSIPGVRR